MKKNRGAKIMAAVALFAIIVSIVGTGILIIIQTVSAPSQTQELTQDQLNELLEMYGSGNTLTGETLDLSGETLDLSGETLDLSGNMINIDNQSQIDTQE